MILNNFTLLYVEDDKETQQEICSILEPCVKELYIANNGLEGLETYKEMKPDIVLSDIGMPIMDGLEMCKEIKTINYRQPIVMLTAFSDVTTLKSTIDLGVDRYIVKPVLDFDKLLDSLNDIAKVLQSDLDKINIERMLQTQSKIASMGEMLGNIAHQWRQPLSIISTSASSFQMKIELGMPLSNEEIWEVSDNIVEQTKYLSQTIDDFRHFFRDDNTNIESFLISSVLEQVKSLTSDSFRTNYIQLIENVQEIELKNNRNQLAQALLNIFNNAKDAFVINNIEKRYFFIDVKKENNILVLKLKDSAGGIKDDVIGKIFEPYFTTKYQSIGTGIGLYMTHQILTKHFSGTIDVLNVSYLYEDVELKGVEFTIKIPLEKI